ncbi:MAG TPA: uridine kinase [Anaerolineae bacterium]|nr:uridine kinase [Anaerolineae bacterium]
MKTIVIGVAGGTGSGKTTVSHRILEQVGAENVAYVQHDSYYRDRSHLPPEERALINFDHPDALETALLAEHVRSLLAGATVQIPVYDFKTHTRASRTMQLVPRPVILLEGILILADKVLCDLMDIKVFVDTDADTRFIRRLRRDIQERGRTMDSVIRQYEATVKPMHLEFVEPSKRYADVIIPEGGFNDVGVDMLVTKIRSLIPAVRG